MSKEPTQTSTSKPHPTTRPPLVSTTTPSWWHPETTPFHSPGYFAPEISVNSNSHADVSRQPLSSSKPSSKPQIGDLSVLSISSFPYFEFYVPSNTKSSVRKPEYELLDPYPADLLQEIENEPYEQHKGTDQEIVNKFRRMYDDFFARVRVFSPITGKKRVPPTRPYVLFLMFYDLCKREAKRLGLQEFTVCAPWLPCTHLFLSYRAIYSYFFVFGVFCSRYFQQGYSREMLARLHATSNYSAEHQLYTLMYELTAQNSIVANDFKTRINEIMSGMKNR